jgi:hypothetical protein
MKLENAIMPLVFSFVLGFFIILFITSINKQEEYKGNICSTCGVMQDEFNRKVERFCGNQTQEAFGEICPGKLNTD